MNQEIDLIVLEDSTVSEIVGYMTQSPYESITFLFGKVFGGKAVATDLLSPEDEEYDDRGHFHVYVKPEFIASNFPKLFEKGKTLVATIHSHPKGLEAPSWGDIERTHKSVIEYYPHQLTGIYCDKKLNFYRLSGDEVVKVEKKVVESRKLKRFDRQIRFLGREGQLLITATNVVLIGVGGGNTIIASDLACMGVGKIVLIDPDKWEESNRNRVFLPPRHVGKNKVESIKRLINIYYPEIEVEAYPMKAEEIPDDVYAQADIIVVGPDTVTGRIFGNRKALEHKKPAVFPAAGIVAEGGKLKSIGGSVQVVIPDDTPCYECIANIKSLDIMKEVLSPDEKRIMSEKYLLGDLLDVPVTPSIISLNRLIAGIALWEIIKLITGIDDVIPLQVYDGTTLRQIKIAKTKNCPACGEFELDMAECIEVKSHDELINYRKGVEA
jgi:molybdopterin/thiamine biosynthesis adenylyltransferase